MGCPPGSAPRMMVEKRHSEEKKARSHDYPVDGLQTQPCRGGRGERERCRNTAKTNEKEQIFEGSHGTNDVVFILMAGYSAAMLLRAYPKRGRRIKQPPYVVRQ